MIDDKHQRRDARLRQARLAEINHVRREVAAEASATSARMRVLIAELRATIEHSRRLLGR